jgi:hypothetical protein
LKFPFKETGVETFNSMTITEMKSEVESELKFRASEDPISDITHLAIERMN